MDPGNAFARKPKARHRVFGSKSLLSDHLWSGAEAQNYVTPAENISSGNLSDETTASKEGISTRSSSLPEDYHTCFDTPCRKYLHENIVQTLSPTHGNVNDRPFESSQQYPEALEYQLARLTLQYRDLSESYTDSNIRLRQAYAEIDDLTKHNLQLQASFTEFPQSVGITRPNQALHNLPMHMSSDPYSIIPRQPSVSSIHNPLLSFTPHQLVAAPSSLQSLNFPANNSNGSAKYGHVQRESITDDVNILEKNITTDAAAENSPTRNRSLEFNNKAAHYHPKSNPASSSLERAAVEMPSCQRPALPKSISIRSPGFLTAKKGVKKEKPSPANSPGQPHRLRLAAPAPPDIAPVSAPVDGDVEYEVYNQGMLKTELCDKWQDTGTCPYGAGCQFAHGMQELRPVIRHPRFKMELCRMVAAGIKCLYGHRCHFRHALSDEEKESRNCK